MTTESVNIRELAVQELAEAGVPSIDDILADIGPMGRLLFCQMAVDETMRLWVALLATDAEESTGTGDERAEALNGISLAEGNLIAACIAVGIIDEAARPPEV